MASAVSTAWLGTWGNRLGTSDSRLLSWTLMASLGMGDAALHTAELVIHVDLVEVDKLMPLRNVDGTQDCGGTVPGFCLVHMQFLGEHQV